MKDTKEIQNRELHSDIMRDMPIGKLLAKMSLPAILSMFVQSMYNVVDTLFVASYSELTYGGNFGTTALGAVTPLQFLLIAVAVGIGMGSNIAIARKLGERKQSEANILATHGLLLAVIAYVVFLILAFTISKPFVALFSDGNQLVEELGTTYITICLALSFGCLIEITLSKILQSTGNMKIPMISQLIGAIINIILDPLLIYGIWIFPELGVAGAGVATVIGQICAMIFVIVMFVVKKHDVTISFRKFKFKMSAVKEIFCYGLPSMVMNAVSSINIMLMNIILVGFNNGVAILGVYYKLQSFVFMPVFGLNQGLIPILSYNIGANNKQRYIEAFKKAVFVAVSIMLVGFVLFLSCAEPFMKAFSATGEYLTDGAYALRVMSGAFLFAGFGVTLSAGLQTLGKTTASLMLSVVRQIMLILPIAYLLAHFYQLKGVWFSYPIAEFISVGAFLPVLYYGIKSKFKSQPNLSANSDSLELKE